MVSFCLYILITCRLKKLFTKRFKARQSNLNYITRAITYTFLYTFVRYNINNNKSIINILLMQLSGRAQSMAPYKLRDVY